MKRTYIIILILTLLLVTVLSYNKFAFLHVTLKYEELDPFDRQVPVYFKGFKVGKSIRIYPDKDYMNTYIDIKLSPHDIILPNNITARLESGERGNYINLLPPQRASVITLKDNDIIEGDISRDLDSILFEKISSGNIDSMLTGASSVMETANKTMDELTVMFSHINDILSEIKTDVKSASSDFAKTAASIESTASKFDRGIKQKSIDMTFDNIAQISENLKETTENFDSITENIDKTTIPKVNCVIDESYKTMQNTSEITGGIKKTLKKRMGMFKLMFGKPAENCP